jgi:uncharacterized protein (TIGR02444 family)
VASWSTSVPARPAEVTPGCPRPHPRAVGHSSTSGRCDATLRAVSSETGEASGLWRWSVRAYGRPGVGPWCLDLQDRLGFDVGIVLACLWAASRGIELDRAELEAVLVDTEPLRSRIASVRDERRQTRGAPGADELYAKLKEAELAAEASLLCSVGAALEGRTARSERSSRAIARRSLERYAGLLGVAAEARPVLEALVDRTLPATGRSLAD